MFCRHCVNRSSSFASKNLVLFITFSQHRSSSFVLLPFTPFNHKNRIWITLWFFLCNTWSAWKIFLYNWIRYDVENKWAVKAELDSSVKSNFKVWIWCQQRPLILTLYYIQLNVLTELHANQSNSPVQRTRHTHLLHLETYSSASNFSFLVSQARMKFNKTRSIFLTCISLPFYLTLRWKCAAVPRIIRKYLEFYILSFISTSIRKSHFFHKKCFLPKR